MTVRTSALQVCDRCERPFQEKHLKVGDEVPLIHQSGLIVTATKGTNRDKEKEQTVLFTFDDMCEECENAVKNLLEKLKLNHGGGKKKRKAKAKAKAKEAPPPEPKGPVVPAYTEGDPEPGSPEAVDDAIDAAGGNPASVEDAPPPKEETEAAAPPSEETPPPVVPKAPPKSAATLTERQLKAIKAISKALGWTPETLDQESRDRFDLPLEELNKADASTFIGELQKMTVAAAAEPEPEEKAPEPPKEEPPAEPEAKADGSNGAGESDDYRVTDPATGDVYDSRTGEIMEPGSGPTSEDDGEHPF